MASLAQAVGCLYTLFKVSVIFDPKAAIEIGRQKMPITRSTFARIHLRGDTTQISYLQVS